MSNKLNHPAIAKKMEALEGKPFKLASITQARHRDLVAELPVYDTVRRWLEVQNPEVFEGCTPVRILRELIEQSAKMTMGSGKDLFETVAAIESILR